VLLSKDQIDRADSVTSHAHASVGRRWPIWLAGIGLVLLTGLVYSNQFSAPLVFDGYPWIYINEKIKSVWPIWTPSMGMMRPIPYLSFSLNYWAGEWDVRGWHVVKAANHAPNSMAATPPRWPGPSPPSGWHTPCKPKA
jgi:hypothetical protein